ncbi:hypothetical protein SDC9_129729 [bioreactor metagenome]|uniref:Uncharacterized protein n=1 Tax=bioreactor metagenome TaxID=1076179 RepID=A0A645D0G0_9ZZZZ
MQRHLGGHGNPRLMPLGARACQALAGCVGGGGVAAEEVDLPPRLHADLRGVGDARRLLVEAAAGVGAGVQRGQQRRARRHLRRAGLLEARARLRHAGVSGLRLCDKLGQQRVAGVLPPAFEFADAAAMGQRGVPLGGDGRLDLRGRALQGAACQHHGQREEQSQMLQSDSRHE